MTDNEPKNKPTKEYKMKNFKKVLVIGASGGSGRKTIEALQNQGHIVSALSRKASTVFGPDVNSIDGSALDKDVLRKAITGQDAVIVILGISENPFTTRLRGPKNTPINIRSKGTELVTEVMIELGVKRLIVQTTYGSGPSKDKLSFMDRMFFQMVLKPQIDDTEIQDQIVRSSGLDWTITQPVHLSDSEEQSKAFTSDSTEVQEMKISRKLVGECNAHLILDNSAIGKTLALSTAS